MAYSAQEWQLVQAYYEEGYSLGKIVDQPDVKIKSRQSISRKATEEGWIKGKNETLTKKEIELKLELIGITGQKETLLNETALIVHNDIVDQKVQRLEYLNTAALRNVQQAMAVRCDDQQDFRHRANTIKHAVEVIDPQQRTGVAVQVNNVQQPIKIDLAALKGLRQEELVMLEDLLAKAAG